MVAGALLGGALFPALVGQNVAVFGERVVPKAMFALAVLALDVAVSLHARSRKLKGRLPPEEAAPLPEH